MKSRTAEFNRIEFILRDFAMTFPGATEEFPWGERAIKVNKRVFLFLGQGEDGFGMSLKLPLSLEHALALSYVEPTHYGLGKHGWVTVHLDRAPSIPVEALKRWVEESYRAVAPKKRVVELDEKGNSKPSRPSR